MVGFTSGKFSNFVSNHILIKNYSIVGLHWGFYRQKNPAKIDASVEGACGSSTKRARSSPSSAAAIPCTKWPKPWNRYPRPHGRRQGDFALVAGSP